MWINIESKNNWHGGGSLIYGKNLQKNAEWIYLPEYPLINSKEQLNNNVTIGIFDSETINSNFYTSWQSWIKTKYLEGNNLFQWEKTHEYRS